MGFTSRGASVGESSRGILGIGGVSDADKGAIKAEESTFWGRGGGGGGSGRGHGETMSFLASKATSLAEACLENAEEARSKGDESSARANEREAERQMQLARGYLANK